MDLSHEIHPTEDTYDGDTFEMFMAAVGGLARCRINYDASHFIKQCMEYLGFIDACHERIGVFHVKDAECNPTAKQGVYGGYKGWQERAGRDRSLGHGQVDFKGGFQPRDAVRVQGLGGVRVGVLPAAPGGGSAARGAVHRGQDHRGDGPGVR